MNTKELHAAIAQKVKKAIELQLWERACEIVEKLGKRESRMASSHTTVSHDLKATIGGKILGIHKSNFVMGGDYLYINVDTKLVFHAQERTKTEREFSWLSELERARMVSRQEGSVSKYLEIVTYLEGGWEHMLDLKPISDVLRLEHIVTEQLEREAREREENARPLTEKEREAARNFGL